MANKFPYLKRTIEPLGVVEQIAAAVTLHPDEDPSPTALDSWFGRMLVPDPVTDPMLATNKFVWKYFGAQNEEVRGRGEFAKYYFNRTLRYPTFDHETYSLKLQGRNKAVVEGVAQIKGWYKRSDGTEANHSGTHYFSYTLNREGERWLVQEWVLRKVNDRESALTIILNP